MARLGNNDIDPRRAGLLLYALQLATCNLNEHQRQNARAAAQQNNPAEPGHPAPIQQKYSPLPSDQTQHPHSRASEQAAAPKEEPCHPEQSTPTASTPPQEKTCHPERSAAESKDLRSTASEPAPQITEPIHYGSGPTPDLQNPQTERAPSMDFTPPAPVWRRLSPAVGRTLLETLGRHHAGEHA